MITIFEYSLESGKLSKWMIVTLLSNIAIISNKLNSEVKI